MSHDLYPEGMRIAAGLRDLDGPNVNPLCHTRVYTHGQRVERSLVLLHGFTNCPQQFDTLGRQFFDRGWNIVIPRYPRHGYTDRLNTSIAELRSEHLLAVANRSTDVASGLGERVTVAGLSLGAILAGLLAQTRDGIERAVLIAPMLGLRPIPGPALTAVSTTAKVLPNFYMWWNNELKDKLGPPYGYPRFSTHAYAALFECGRQLVRSARAAAPRARSIAVITNAGEPRLDNRFTYRLIESWRRHGANVESFEFPAVDQLTHDLIDPGNAAQKTDYVYPIVTRYIEGG
ncbi:MAG: alpha/beta fold hydrolase [Chloroflexi bacterium]|nr:MAG: alpha/beta fold hydrolase [Chloroflexota bacterium]TMF40370.1 MAG: alpha/beta fold hydrolase [Chloroflexota bacterium]